MDDAERAAIAEEEDRRIARIEQQMYAERTKAQPGEECADCAEPLATHRQPYGTCITCQEDREVRAKHYRRDRE